jgi:predicted nucleic acid-binding protein
VLEVANALRKRLLKERSYRQEDLEASVVRLFRLGPTIIPSPALVLLALRHARDLSLYDAVYVALAESMGIPVCTLDRGLARGARRAGVAVLEPGTAPFDRFLAGPS